MGRADHLVLGDWNVVCYQCGFKRKASQMEQNWQGYWVCPEHNEPRQTQDFVRGMPDRQNPPWVQPAPGVTYAYTDAPVGIGDGVTFIYQFGSGLGTDAVSYSISSVSVNGTPIGGWFPSPGGKINLLVAPALGAIITATGSETLL